MHPQLAVLSELRPSHPLAIQIDDFASIRSIVYPPRLDLFHGYCELALDSLTGFADTVSANPWQGFRKQLAIAKAHSNIHNRSRTSGQDEVH